MNALAHDSVLVAIDLQPTFMKSIHEAEKVLRRSEFLLKIAQLLEIPVLATEQYPDRMGGTDSRIVPYLSSDLIFEKMAFSCCGSEGFMNAFRSLGRGQAVLIGIETHICVSQTAHDLMKEGWEVFVCADAVSSRSADRREIGLQRLRHSGAVTAHTESIAYEWLQGADHSKFREALQIVKSND